MSREAGFTLISIIFAKFGLQDVWEQITILQRGPIQMYVDESKISQLLNTSKAQ